VLSRQRPQILGILVAILLTAVLASTAEATIPEGAWRVYHDPDGRLKAIVKPEGESAIYRWDADGNLVEVSREPGMAIVQVTPMVGHPGDLVEIEGRNFSPTRSEDTVEFNGVAASVLEASATSLTVEVPEGSSTGTIKVKTEVGTAKSPDSFKVVNVKSPPVVSGIAPTVGAIGQTVTLSGEAFDRDRRNDELRISGGEPFEPVSASSHSLTFVVPNVPMGGPVEVTTSEGSTVGPELFVIPPDTYPSIHETGNLDVEESKALSFTGSLESSLLHLQGAEGQQMNIVLARSAGSEYADGMSLWSPGGAKVGSCVFSSGAETCAIQTPKLAESGVYTLAVRGWPEDEVEVTAYEVEGPPEILTPVASADGGRQHVTISSPGVPEVLTVNATAGEAISLRTETVELAESYYLEWLDEEGNVIRSSLFASESGTFFGPQTFAVAGQYALRIRPLKGGTGSMDITSWEVRDQAEVLEPQADPNGISTDVDLTIPGQVARFAVPVTKYEKVSSDFEPTTWSSESIWIRWLSPSGEVVSETSESGFFDPLTFSQSGTYTMEIDPEGMNAVEGMLTLWEAPDLTGEVFALSGTGNTETSIIEIPGQRALVMFEAKAGEAASIEVTESAASVGEGFFTLVQGTVTVIGPSEATIATSSFEQPLEFVTEASGIYMLVVDPESKDTGPVEVAVGAYHAEPVLGSMTPGTTSAGTTEHVELTAPGQVARYSVEVSEGEKVSMRPSAVETDGKYWARWKDVEGSVLEKRLFSADEEVVFVSPRATASGTFVLEIDPLGNVTGSLDLTLWDASDSTGPTLSLSSEGESAAAEIEIPGQHERLNFAGNSGESIVLEATESTFPEKVFFEGEWTLLGPEGEVVEGGRFGKARTVELPSSGEYTIIVEPNENGVGRVKLTLLSVEVSFGFEFIELPAATPSGTTTKVTIAKPGHSTVEIMEAEPEEEVFARVRNSSFPKSVTTGLLAPNPGGSQFASLSSEKSEYLYGPLKGGEESGYFQFLVEPEAATTGSFELTTWKDPPLVGSIAPTSEGTSESYEVEIPGQHQVVHFTGTTGETLTLKARLSTIAVGKMSVLRPTGESLGQSEFSSAAGGRLEVSLPESGTYSVVLDPEGVDTGEVLLTAFVGSHVSWSGDAQSENSLIDLPMPAEQAGPRPANVTRFAIGPAVPVGPEDKSGSKDPQLAPGRRSPVIPITRKMREYRANVMVAWHPPTTRKGAEGWKVRNPTSPWARIRQRRARRGTTALSGQALSIDGLPLANVEIRVKGSRRRSRTDAAGRFLLSRVPSGEQILIIDGDTVAGRKRYGLYSTEVSIARHRTTRLPYTVWLTPLMRKGTRRLASPTRHEVRLRTSRIPGLEVRIPAGTVIRNRAGKRIRSLNLSPVPVTRAPFPLPPFVEVPVYFTVQPGLARLSKGAQIVYPNWGHDAPGQRVQFWNYDPTGEGWYVYGEGTVSADGRQVVPDKGVRVWEFTGAMIVSSPIPPTTYPTGLDASAGDPVDLHSGLFTYEKTDVNLPGPLPLTLGRTYRPGDSNVYEFGKGTTNQYDMRLWSQENYKQAYLILPSGQRIHYVRTSPGAAWYNAVYEAPEATGEFYGSTISWKQVWNGAGWDLTLTNGITYQFGDTAGLQGIEDGHGDWIHLRRAGGQYGRIEEVSDSDGKSISFTYQEARIAKAVANDGRAWRYGYANQYLSQVTDPDGNTTHYAYNGIGQMTSITTPRGIKYLENEYDAAGRVERQRDADGGSFSFAYETSLGGKVEATTVTEPTGSKRHIKFDAAGRPLSETAGYESAEAETMTWERESGTGLLTAVTDPLGRKTSYVYDKYGNPTEVTQMAGTPEAETTKYECEAGSSRVTAATDPMGNTTTFKYGKHGELLKATDPLGNPTSYEYDSLGQISGVTNPESETAKFGYTDGIVTSEVDPLGRETKLRIGPAGEVTESISPGGSRETYSYDAAGQMTGVVDPMGNESSISYDPDGNVIGLTDAKGGQSSIAYNDMDRRESSTDALSRTQTLTYDKGGHVVEAVDPNGAAEKMTYDELGRLVKTEYGATPLGAESTVEYEYDAANRLVRLSDSEDGEYSLSYDNFDHITDVEGPNGSVEYEYDPDGRRTKMVPSEGEPVSYEYDEAGRLTELSSPAASVKYGYDAANRLTKLTLPNGIVKHYQYDAAGEPTAIEFDHEGEGLGAVYYSYDAEGQIDATWGSLANMSMPSAFGPAAYDAANEMTSLEGTELEYDSAGDLTSDGSSEYVWNARRQLIAVTGVDAASFAYDPFGRRVSETVEGDKRELLYDGQNVIHESVEGGTSASLLAGFGPDVNYARTSEGRTESVLTNSLGSTIGLTDELGEVKTSYEYTPFGVTTESGAETGNRMAFTGREASAGGLQYNRARYYNPAAGRFISPDPVSYALGQRIYAYASDDPLDYSDPSGRFSWNPIEDVKEGAELFESGAEALEELGKEAVEAAIAGAESAGSTAGSWASAVAGAAVDAGEWVVTHPGVVASALALVACTAAYGSCTEEALLALTGAIAEDGIQACSPTDFLKRFGITLATSGITAGFGAIFSTLREGGQITDDMLPSSVKGWLLGLFTSAPGGIASVAEMEIQQEEHPQGGSESSSPAAASGSC
jgi:RHS repeat-associated protein